mgnify:FL=1
MASETSPTEVNTMNSKNQQLFISFILAVLVDLTVLGLFNEFWESVVIASFSIALTTALLLQVLLKITFKIEHRVAAYFNNKSGKDSKVMKFISLWAILFFSKILILEAINIAFGNQVLFLGPYHGIVAFVVVIIAILIAEGIISKIYKSLA